MQNKDQYKKVALRGYEHVLTLDPELCNFPFVIQLEAIKNDIYSFNLEKLEPQLD